MSGPTKARCDKCGQTVSILEAAIHMARHISEALDRANSNPALVPVRSRKQ